MTPATFDAYWGSAAAHWMRQKVRGADRAGYRFAMIARDDYLDDIYAINTSMPERQGRPMAEAYLHRLAPQRPLPDFPCPRHALRQYGVLRDGHLYAYAWVYVIGEMCLFSTILGHGEHMKAGRLGPEPAHGTRCTRGAVPAPARHCAGVRTTWGPGSGSA